jgi:hypothetical protein
MPGRKGTARLRVRKLRRLRQLEEDDSGLKRLVPDLSLDKHMLSEALPKKSEARPPAYRFACGPAPVSTGPTERWSMDFVHDNLADGCPFRVLKVVHHWSRHSEAGFQMSG